MLDLADFSYRLHPAGIRSARQLRAMADSYQGGRAFIVGNGPSLQAMDLTPLAGEHTFVLNRGYLLFDRIGGPSTFLVAVNRHVIQQWASDIEAAPVTTFLSWRAREFAPDSEALFLWSRHTPMFSTDLPRRGMWEGSTVTYVAMQVAYHLGFSEVILIGVDHSFEATGKPHTLVTSTSADRDHFSADYFGPGFKWQLPDLPGSEVAYRMAKDAYERAGRRILDATVGGKLTVFPKVDYRAVVRKG
jgi:hypothetical protein